MKYKIATVKGAFEIEGEPHFFHIGGVDYHCAVSQFAIDPKTQTVINTGEWIITELSTGMKICHSPAREHALLFAQTLMEKADMASIFERGKAALKLVGIEFPLNTPTP